LEVVGIEVVATPELGEAHFLRTSLASQ
jgi:hypothetical protein